MILIIEIHLLKEGNNEFLYCTVKMQTIASE